LNQRFEITANAPIIVWGTAINIRFILYLYSFVIPLNQPNHTLFFSYWFSYHYFSFFFHSSFYLALFYSSAFSLSLINSISLWALNFAFKNSSVHIVYMPIALLYSSRFLNSSLFLSFSFSLFIASSSFYLAALSALRASYLAFFISSFSSFYILANSSSSMDVKSLVNPNELRLKDLW